MMTFRETRYSNLQVWMGGVGLALVAGLAPIDIALATPGVVTARVQVVAQCRAGLGSGPCAADTQPAEGSAALRMAAMLVP